MISRSTQQQQQQSRQIDHIYNVKSVLFFIYSEWKQQQTFFAIFEYNIKKKMFQARSSVRDKGNKQKKNEEPKTKSFVAK